ncbi:hypothetical protein TUM12370_34000 [Salmonella enterica subsp. enterica serovar Choleraesuis]|nr:hypothetical protein TUM12370_34000 [Salmonella enterica subsp. enterica serovar Choleraesuis]
MKNLIFSINKTMIFNHKECYISAMDTGEKSYIGAKPSALLLFLIKNQGEPMTLDGIGSALSQSGILLNKTSIIQYISRLRKIFRTFDFSNEIITTIKGGGYHIAIDIPISNISEDFLSSSPSDDFIEDECESVLDVTKLNSTDDVITNSLGASGQRPVFDNSVGCAREIRSLCGLKWLIAVIVMIAAICIAFIQKNKFSEVRYRYDFTAGGCTFYVDRDSVTSNSKIKQSILSDVGAGCKRKPFVYITYFESSSNYSLFSCNSKITQDNTRTICSSVARFDNE